MIATSIIDLVLIILITKHLINHDFIGYDALMMQNLMIQNTTQQNMANSDDQKTTKYPSISKGVPILSETTRRLWQFKLKVNTMACDNGLGNLIFGDPKMMTELGLAPVFLTEDQKRQRAEWVTNKAKFEDITKTALMAKF